MNRHSQFYLIGRTNIRASVQDYSRRILALGIHLQVLVFAVVSASHDEHDHIFEAHLAAVARHDRSSRRGIVVPERLC